MAVDPQAQKLLDLIKEANRPAYHTVTPEQARAMAVTLPPGPEVRTRDVVIPGPGGKLTMRAYYPPGDGPYPALVWFHGGGFVVGSVEGHDPLCRQLCVDADCCVVSVEYRLAPETKFPGAVQDAYAALSWIHENADDIEVNHQRLAVGGDSAGAALAAAITCLAKERRAPPIAQQVLVYPVTDLRSLDTPSYLEFAEDHFLTRDTMAWFRDHYLEDESQRHDPRASVLAATNLIGLPPTLVITAECDVLRDEGEAYGARLAEAGVATTVKRYDGMIHAFVSMYAYMDKGREAITLCGDTLRRAFNA